MLPIWPGGFERAPGYPNGVSKQGLLGAVVLAGVGLATLGLVPSSAGVRVFAQCPPVGLSAGCQSLIVVNDRGVQLQTDPAQGAYDGNKDSLVGVQNNSSRAVASVWLAAPKLFDFDGDGLCNSGQGAAPSGCQPSPGTGVACNPSVVRTNHCSFPPPPGEPPNYVEPGATNYAEVEGDPNVTPHNRWPNGDLQSGYEGPRTWFSEVSDDVRSGRVNFSPPLAPGEATYFALERSFGQDLTIRVGEVARTQTRVRLVASGRSGPKLVVRHGRPVRATALISGPRRVSSSWGMVTYTVFRDSACKGVLGRPSRVPVVNGRPQPSGAFRPGMGTYYVRASYSGDLVYAPSSSPCRATVLLVVR
jgi:hypothetical protein